MPITANPRVETGYASVDGIRTFYRRLPGEGPPVVLVHGVPTHSGDWEELLAALEGPAVAFDLPGFGRADRPDPAEFDCTFRSYGRWVGQALDAFGIAEHKLVVHDWGGVGLLAAQERPELVQRLVLINCVPFLPGFRWHRTARIWRTPRLGELSNKVWNRRIAGFALRESRGDWSAPDPEFLDMVWDGLDEGTFDAILRLYRSADPPDLAAAGARLGEIDCPSLIVWAQRDRYTDPKYGRAYAEALGADLFEPPGAGHWPWRDDATVIPRIARFLEDQG